MSENNIVVAVDIIKQIRRTGNCKLFTSMKNKMSSYSCINTFCGDEFKLTDDLDLANSYCAVNREIFTGEIINSETKLSQLGNTVGFTWFYKKKKITKKYKII